MKWGTPWEEERKKYKLPYGKDWQVWFAWYPVKITLGRWVWLEEVQFRYWDGMSYNVPEYREKL